MTMHVNLTPELEDFVREKVQSGLYRSASEVLREALRLVMATERARRLSETRVGVTAGTAGPQEVVSELLRLGERLHHRTPLRAPGIDTNTEHASCIRDPTAHWGEEAPGHLVRAPDRLKKLLRDED